MPQIELPAVKAFTIPSLGWLVTDYRDLGSAEQTQARSRWTKAVVTYNEAQGIDRSDVLCQWATPKHHQAAAKRFESAWEDNPRIDARAFMLANPPKRFRFHQGSERRGALLGVKDGSRIIGGIYCSNYTPEIDTRNKLTARSMLWVGVEPIRGRLELDVWMDAIIYMIDNDLELADGRVLDFIGYDFRSDAHLRDGLSARAPLNAFIARMAAHFDSSGAPDAEGDIRYRRRGAP